MAPEARPAPEHLSERIGDDPRRFDFYQLMRLIECAHPELPRLGRSARPSQDPVRFGQEPSVAFPPTAVAGLRRQPKSGRAQVDVLFFGLLGANGPMPLHFTEYVRERDYNSHDPTLRAFLDVFHHRMITLLYRAWGSARPEVQRDRSDSDRISNYIGSLVGLGVEENLGRDSVPDDAKRFYAARFNAPSRPAETLAAILADDFGVPVSIEPFIGNWIEIPDQNRCRLGASRGSGTLGESVFCGEQLWDCQSRFRVVMGPMSIAHFRTFLPGSARFGRLRDWVRGYLSRALSWEVQLILRAEDVPPTRLGGESRLGLTTWLTTEPPDHDVSDAIFDSGDP
ncbi:MAG: type VI secretion system baseplate subunit TssG [Phycisphaerales bacterium JB040]